MKIYINIILCIVIFSSCKMNLNSIKDSSPQIKKIVVYALPYSSKTRIKISPNKIKSVATYKAIIKDDDMNLDSLIDSLVVCQKDIGDVRVMLKVYFKHFCYLPIYVSKYNRMQINNDVICLDTNQVEIIKKYLPRDYNNYKN